MDPGTSYQDRIGENSLGVTGWADCKLLDFDVIHAERMATEAKEEADKTSATSCWLFGDQSRAQEAVHHNVRVAFLIEALGESGAGRRAVLRAIAEMQGLTED